MSPVKTPLYSSDYAKIDKVTAQISAWARTQPGVTAIDTNRLLVNAEGLPNASYFRADGVNLNEHGYLRLSTVVQNELEIANYPAN